MGGIGAPDIQITLRAQAFAPRLQLVAEKALLPDIVGGVLAGSFGSLTVRNHALDDVVITGISADDAGYRAGLAVDDAWLVVSGQTRPIAFNLTCIKTPCPSRVSLTLEYVFAGQHDIATLTVSQVLPERSVREPHKITFLHPGAIVSYAILRPPPLNMSCQPEEHEALPVLLSLHGAGLEADDPLVAHALDPVPDLCAWVLFPTGVTPWSGDDWHAWGFEDVKAAIRAISSWITATGWPGPGVDIERWLVSGHSNGGQGTWYAMAHQPDNIIAAAPVSGYSSIQNYVPFKLWHSMQPAVRAILDGSISSYRHEMLLSNVKGIPVLQQHGSNDDNVPAYHSRLMYQMIHEADASSHYVEFPGQGHWVDGILTTAPLKGFYHEHLNHKSRMKKTSESFCLVVANPADTGSKNGFRILQLVTPGQLGKLNVGVDETHALRVTASNVLCFELRGYRLRQASNVEVDGQRVELPFVDGLRQIELCRGPISRSWQVKVPQSEWDLKGRPTRSGRQLGAMDSILRTQGRLRILTGSNSRHIALQVSRNLCQYFAADTEIVGREITLSETAGNVVQVAIGMDLPTGLFDDHPITIDSHNSLSIKRDTGGEGNTQSESLELVVWGADEEGLRTAARLAPMLTGVGQPDFVVVSKGILRKGADGVLALGFFDTQWKVSKNSFFT
ncbi:hypothetical protein H2203_006497 [Taxawa tesnikishii (nom. ined.)]|nr:hypothetical protein H2203_006497 [Dothideales sp. JES 119]